MFRNLTPIVKKLLIINGGLLFLTYLLGNAGMDLYHILGLFYFKSEYFMPFQFVTHMFMHGNFIHLLFNMYALLLFGSILENIWGSKRFLFYYLFTGLGAAVLHTAVNWYMINDFYMAVQDFLINPSLDDFKYIASEFPKSFSIMKEKPQYIIENWSFLNVNDVRAYVDTALQYKINIPTVGASGAVFGLLLAFGVMFPNAPLGIIFIPIRIKAKWFVIGYGLLELISGIMNGANDNIAHFAHLGGMLFGYILLKYWYKGNFNQGDLF